MSPPSLPPVPYHASALRPSWPSLPAALREAVADRLGAPVVTARVAGAGFTRGFAAVLGTADGGRAFVKAAPSAEQPHLVDWYAREAAILDRLPVDLPAPRPRWTLSEAGWFVLCTDAVDGHTPRLPWAPAELEATLAGYATVAAALADPPAELTTLGLPHLADLARSDILWWEEVAAGREPAPVLPTPARGRLPELVALESRLPVRHRCDRPDPRRPAGGQRADRRAGAGLVLRLDLDLFRAGLVRPGRPAAHRVRRRAGRGPALRRTPGDRRCAPDALDATLAALAGYYLTGPRRHRRRPRRTCPRTSGGAASRRSTGSPAARAGRNLGPDGPGDRRVRARGDRAVLARPGRPGNLALRAAMTHVRHLAHKLTNPSYQDEAVAWRTSSPRSSATGRTRRPGCATSRSSRR
ncbi:hypothetical protein GCM10027614_31970 [Micromonospora vulcania]